MGRIRMTRITYGKGNNTSRKVRIHASKKGNKNRCPNCGRFM